MPPESWCGCRPRTFLDSGIRTRSSMRRASASASLLLLPWCRLIDSAICSPMVKTGLSEVIGSWNTIARSAPRRWRISAWLALARSRLCPLRRVSVMRPLSIRPPPCSTRRISASEETDLPEPDSPTIASVSPASTWKERSRTACTSRVSVRNVTLSPATSRTRFFWLSGMIREHSARFRHHLHLHKWRIPALARRAPSHGTCLAY